MTLVKFEMLKLLRSRRPAVTMLALLLFLALMLIGFYTYAQNETGGQAEFRYTFENRSYFNGLTFAVYAFYFGVTMLLPIFASIEGGSQIAGETADGTMQLLLTRPLSRTRLFFTKTLVAVVFLAIVVGLFLFAALTAGLFAVGWGELNLYPGVLQMTDRPQHLSVDQALGSFLMAWPAATVATLAPLAMSLLVSTWVRSPVNAVGVSIIMYLILYVISEIHFFSELRPFLFTSSMSYWRGLFRASVDWATVLREACKLLAFASLFLALAFRRFRVREEL